MDVFKTLILDTPDSLDNISGVLPVVNGGTGADNASDARVNLLPDYTGNANKVLSLNGTATDVEWTSNGAGDVVGPASSTDNAVARFDSTTGKVIQNSGVTVSDANLLTADALSINNNTTLGSSNSDTVTFNARIASEFTPATDNTYDLGRVGHEWRDLYLDGTANIDSLVADTADINGGTIDGTTIGATTPSTVAATSLSASTQVDFFGRLFGLDVSNETRLYAGSAGLSIYDHIGTGRILNLTQSSTKVGVVGTGDVATFTSTGLAVTGSVTATNSANDAGSVAMLLQNSDGNAGVGSRLGWRLDNLANEWGYINVNRVGGGATAQMDFAVNNAAYTGSPSVAMTVLGSGNVGINDTTPSYKLDVNGTFRNTGALWNDDSINLNRNGAGYVRHRYIDQSLRFGVTNTAGTLYYPLELNPSADYVRFSRDGGAETMRIDSSGNVLIGATSLPSGSNDAWGFDRTNSIVKISRSTTGVASQMRFYNPNGEVGSISTSGSATAFNTSSDYRLKENVVPMSGALQRIGNLKPSRFNFISDDSVVVDGFIAHEVQEVVPEAISGEMDAMRDEEYEVTPAVLDDDENEVTPAVMGTRSVPEYQGIDQSKLVPLLVGAVQELTARLEALENN